MATDSQRAKLTIAAAISLCAGGFYQFGRALAEAAGKAAPGVTTSALGPALRIVVPDRLLFRASGKGELSDPLKAVIAELGKAAGELPSASVIVAAPAPKTAEDIQAALVGTKGLDRGRVLVNAGGKDKGAELFLLAP